MTQKIFDTDNAEDMALLWSILPEQIVKLVYEVDDVVGYDDGDKYGYAHMTDLIKIDFHNKTEITRPIQEATEADIGKLCRFWNNKSEEFFGRLGNITRNTFIMVTPLYEDLEFRHCLRLTKQEIEELC